MKKILFSLLLLTLLISPAMAWWDTDWTRRKEITVTNPAAVQVLTNVTYDADMQADFDDLRFVDGDDTTVLDHWIESKSDGYYANVWVELADTGSDAYMYYGNPSATSESSITATMEWGDDFSAGSLNAAIWNQVSTSTITFSNGIISIASTAAAYRGIASEETFGVGYIVRARASASNTANQFKYFGFMSSDGAYSATMFADQNAGLSLRTRNGGSAIVTAVTANDGNYHILESIRVDASNATGRVDATSANTTSQISSASLPVFIGVYTNAGGGTSTAYCDWICVRRYAATEPALAYGSEELQEGAPPVAAFTANITSGCAPLSVQFNDTSDCDSCTAWNWSFGGSEGWFNTTDGGSKNATHTYTDAGSYTVKLYVTNTSGTNSTTKTNYITVSDVPTASFAANATSGAKPLPVHFTDTSSGPPTSWYWIFGDGNTSTSQNPDHTYSSTGVFNVSFKASNACGFDWDNSTTITVSNATDFNRQDIPMSPIYSLAITLKDYTTGAAFLQNTTITTSEGDSYTTSTGAITIYLDYGLYSVCAAAADYTGQCQNVYMSGNKTLTLYLSPYTAPSQGAGISYPPHNVKFQVMTLWGAPIEGVTVTAQGYETTAPGGLWDMLITLLGIDLESAPIHNESMTGTTGTDGAIDFMMIEAVNYQVNFTKAGEVDTSWSGYPKDDYYPIFTTGTGIFPAGYDPNVVIQVNVTGTEIDADDAEIMVNYTSSLAGTTSVFVSLNQVLSNGTETEIANTTETGETWSHTFNVADQRDESYFVRVTVDHATLGTVNRDYSVYFPPGPITLGIPEDLLLYIGIAIMIFSALFFGQVSVGAGCAVFTFVGWILLLMRWLDDLGPVEARVGVLVFATVVTILANFMFRSKRVRYE